MAFRREPSTTGMLNEETLVATERSRAPNAVGGDPCGAVMITSVRVAEDRVIYLAAERGRRYEIASFRPLVATKLIIGAGRSVPRDGVVVLARTDHAGR